MSAPYNNPLRLINTIAAIRGMELMDKIVTEAKNTVEHDESKRVTYFTELFFRIHRDLFRGAEHQAGPQDNEGMRFHRPGELPTPHIQQAFRKAMREFVSRNGNENGHENGNGNGAHITDRLFDANGMVNRLPLQKAAAELATLYTKIRNLDDGKGVFKYGNMLTLNFFMAALGKLPAFQEVYPAGIDFRRLDTADLAAFNNPRADEAALQTAFEHALDFTKTHGLDNSPHKENRLQPWPKSMTHVAEVPFLSYEHTDTEGKKVKCLVTVNGGLIPLEKIEKELENHIYSNKMTAEFRHISTRDIIGHLPGTEALREPGKNIIDGIEITRDAAPLVCLDANILTGLRPLRHTDVLNLIQQYNEQEGKKHTLFHLNRSSTNDHKAKGFEDALVKLAGEDERLASAVRIAAKHINNVTKQIDREKDRFLGDVKPVPSGQKPQLFISMGGGGSGKTAVEEIAQAHCGGNYVVASLDKFRDSSDIYKLLRAAGHHGDDYSVVEPFASKMRDWVADAARERNMNLLYDGTGAVFETRYSTIAKAFNEKGYETRVCGVDTHLPTAMDRVEGRFKSDERALPWLVVGGKHTRTPKSQMQAEASPFVGHLCFFSNDGAKGTHHLILETFTITPQELEQIKNLKRNGGLAEHFKTMMKTRPDSTLRALSTKDGKLDAAALEAHINRIPHFTDANTAYTLHRIGHSYRLTAIYDESRYISLLEKAMLNPHAADKEGIFHKPAELAFHISEPGKADEQKPWVMRCVAEKSAGAALSA